MVSLVWGPIQPKHPTVCAVLVIDKDSLTSLQRLAPPPTSLPGRETGVRFLQGKRWAGEGG